jgi:CPA2 family monovalent cation:H+ antiporter-2
VFTQIAILHNREIFILSVTVVALGLAYSASLFGLSLALGAFVAGIVVAESDLSHQILGDILPLRDIFSGLFFVSIGMLVDPLFVVQNLPHLLVAIALIIGVKGLVVSVIASVLGTRLRTAILVGAVLGQSAEFSFLLAEVGSEVGVVGADLFSLMLSAAAVSIVLSPWVLRASVPVADALNRWFHSTGRSSVEAEEVGVEVDGHAIICGAGRVGRVIRHALTGRADFVVIEEDARVVQILRRKGVQVVQGDATTAAVLLRAGIEHARVLFVAIADPIAVRQVVGFTREHRPELPIIVRTHSETERRFLSEMGVDEVVLGEHELALEMARHGLAIAGVPDDEVAQTINYLRRNPVPNPPE